MAKEFDFLALIRELMDENNPQREILVTRPGKSSLEVLFQSLKQPDPITGGPSHFIADLAKESSRNTGRKVVGRAEAPLDEIIQLLKKQKGSLLFNPADTPVRRVGAKGRIKLFEKLLGTPAQKIPGRFPLSNLHRIAPLLVILLMAGSLGGGQKEE